MGGSKAKSFTAVLEPLQTGMGWVIARIPFDVAKTWPERVGLRVRGEIEDLAIKTTLMAGGPGGKHFLLVNRKMQAGEGQRGIEGEDSAGTGSGGTAGRGAGGA